MTTLLKNTSFIDALHFKNAGTPPIWLMRQAGRYLPEYRAIRKNHTFMEMVKNPKIVCEVTAQPLQRFKFDAAILFSDILMLPHALGMPLEFKESVGPVFQSPLNTIEDLVPLKKGSVSSLDYVFEAIEQIQQNIDVPLIGFAGAPFTVASYMIEGGSSKTLAKTKRWLINDKSSFLDIMEFLTEKTIEYLNKQADLGVAAVQLFDTWAGALSESQFRECSFPYLKRIIDSVSKKVPVILFSKAATAFAQVFQDLGAAGIAFDINANMAEQRKKMPSIVLQGNLDPDVLLADPEIVQKEAGKILDSMKNDPGFIFNLGHGILPETPLESVQALIDKVRHG